jgi:hypothetical protein
MGNSNKKSISPAIVDYAGQNYKEIKEQWVIQMLFLEMIKVTYTSVMALPVMDFQDKEYKIREIFA